MDVQDRLFNQNLPFGRQCCRTQKQLGGLFCPLPLILRPMPHAAPTKPKVQIAIDGYSSCGKSTLAKALARELHFAYIDSGAMYRAVTLHMMRTDTALDDAARIAQHLKDIHITFKRNKDSLMNETYLNDENVEQAIRTMEVSNLVSEVSAIATVRRAMVELQQRAGRSRNIVMEGRDIGTTVFPEAAIKIFMTASPEVRAARRHLELLQKGQNVSLQAIEANLAHRDYEDSHRAESPLRQAEDATILDNTHLNEEEQLAWALQLVHSRTRELA